MTTASPSRIAIDARKLHDYGIGTYVRNLVREFAAEDSPERYVLICQPRDEAFVRSLGPRFEPLVDRSANYSIRELVSVPLDLRRARIDMFHSPHYVVTPLVGCPVVATIHDCIHLRFPQYLPNRAAHAYARTFMAMGARKARRVITVSQASKDDIQHYLRTPADKIDVIHNGLDQRFLGAPDQAEVDRVRDRLLLNAPFILYAGNSKPHKNVERLIEAFAVMRRSGHEDVKLLIVGDELPKYPGPRRLVHRHHLHQHVRFLGFVSDAILAALYRLARVFVFPSLFEGFGFPPLEAMASGTPVITSNVSSLPEVVGDAAVTIDPLDAAALAAAISRVLTDEALRAMLIERGRVRVQAFSWTRAARDTRAVYRRVLGG